MVKQEHVLIQHLDELHTTPAGAMRIQRNLNLPDHDVITWCKEQIMAKEAIIAKNGKNWYVSGNGCILTIHAGSYTIITAHKQAE